MKIGQTDISLLSEHTKQQEIHKKSISLNTDENGKEEKKYLIQDKVVISSEASIYKRDEKSSLSIHKTDRFKEERYDKSISPQLRSLIDGIEEISGKRVNVSFMQNLMKYEPSEMMKFQNIGMNIQDGTSIIDEETRIEKENLSFSAYGNVQTEDGRKINFSLAFKMQQETTSFIKAKYTFKDPLVLNFGTDIVSFSDVKHKFDLDLDGKSDEFSFVGEGSGFLALDKNKDGVINSGYELFGPSKGSGFKELSAYDTDHNNWIDENDDIFEQLVIWTKDDDGKENLFSLKDKNVGALYLGAGESSFEMKDKDGKLQGLMKESSIYLGEKGGIGTLQEIDLVI